MEQKYTQEQMKKIIAIILENCAKISAVNFCKVYKWMFGEETPVKVLNGALYTIGNVAYFRPKRDDIIVIVSQGNGKAGMFFAINGIYYKNGFLSKAQYLDYEECCNVDSFLDLRSDDKFSSNAIDDMFGQIQSVLNFDK